MSTGYQPKVHKEPGGHILTVESGGVIQVKAGGTIDASANAGDNNVLGTIAVLHRIVVPDAATGNVDVVLTNKTRVVDAWVLKTSGDSGSNANTIQVLNSATAITEALSINGLVDTTIKRFTTIDDAAHEIAAGGTLRVTRTKAGGNAACIVYVLGMRVP